MTSPPSSFELGINMKRLVKFFIMIFLLGAGAVCAGDARVKLIPDLHSGQTITYLIRYRSDKTVKTESNVVAPMVPNAAQMDAHGLLRIEILDVQQQGAKPVMHARAEFLTLDSGVWLKRPGDKNPNWDRKRVDPQGKRIEFTISHDGQVEKVKGLDTLFPDQQQAWQEWMARFALAWVLAANGLKVGDKSKPERAEQAAAPVAGLNWARDSAYVRDEPCHARQLSILG